MRRKLATLVSTAGLLCTMTLSAGIVLAGNPSADIDQCANDPANSSPNDGCDTSATQWVNGNLGASKSVYGEGDSIPYRLRFGNLSLAPHNVVIEWDTTKAGKHALDYITTYTRSVTTANACLGVTQSPACNTAASTFPIPKDPQVDNGSGSPIVQAAGDFTIYGGTITAVSAYSYPNGTGFAGDKSARLTVTFTANVANPVLAWGGHIAQRNAGGGSGGWGAGNSAVAISGSPYHTRLVNLDGSGGNQDRSLSADAVIFPGSLTVVKHSNAPDSTNFPFTTTGGLSLLPATFGLIDSSSTPPDPSQLLDDGGLAGIRIFGTYKVQESTVGGWDLTGRSCTATSPNGGGATNDGTNGVSIVLKEGENWTCIFTNTPTPAPSLTIDKTVTGLKNPDLTTDSDGKADQAGDVISYSILVTNTGNVPLTGVSVVDTLVTNLDCDGSPGVPLTTTGITIAVGGSITCTGTHTVTQTELDNNGGGDGKINNTATADSNETPSSNDSADVDIVRSPSLSIDKTADETSYDSVGDVIHYHITATNTGNVTLAVVTVTDADATGLSCNPANGSSLAPGASMTCTASHTITQADINAGSYKNTACVDDGVGAGGAASICDDVTTPADQNPALSIVKLDDGEKFDVGDVISYTIEVTNIGNVTLHDVVVTDPNASNLVCTPTTPVANLAPLAKINCTANHTATLADLQAGSYVNEACADDGLGDGDALGAAEACDDVTTPGKAIPGVATTPSLVPNDHVVLSGLTGTSTGGSLIVELQAGTSSAPACGTASPFYTHTFANAGNGSYDTTNTTAISADKALRWCTMYTGDANNAARGWSDDNELVRIDFYPFGAVFAGFGAAAIPLIAWALWSRRRRDEDKTA